MSGSISNYTKEENAAFDRGYSDGYATAKNQTPNKQEREDNLRCFALSEAVRWVPHGTENEMTVSVAKNFYKFLIGEES